MPATSQSMPALRSRWPASAVTVVLPFVPVTAITVSRAACHANSSMSPNTGSALGKRLADDFLLERKARTHAHGIHAIEQSGREGPGVQFAGEVLLPRRLAPAVGDAHLAAFALDPARHREPGVAEPQDQHAPARQRRRCRARQQLERRFAHHLSLRVDRPKSTSIMVMIQKRTTTWLSFQPSSS